MFTYDDYLKAEYRKEGEAQGIKKGEAQGTKKGEAKGRNEMMLPTYTNMKNKNYKDGDICSLLGISLYKLRQIKKLAQEATKL
ncbi:MAG: hypothetical protein K5787_08340 [Lentisphaeria bacterium]|nr:hypothetical protein [Lentisphaeria bacterium]